MYNVASAELFNFGEKLLHLLEESSRKLKEKLKKGEEPG